MSACTLHILDVKDLVEVLNILTEHNFDSTCYVNLGLYLGLLNPTIKAVKSRCRDDSESCLRECLVRWLEKADEVEEKGGPTWYALIKALRSRSINQVAVADAIDRESKT